MDKEKIKNDFKSLISNISNEIISNSVFKLLDKLKQEISDLSSSLAQQIKSFSKVSGELPGQIDQKMEQFDKLQKAASSSIQTNNQNLKNEVDRMVENNAKLETNFNNNFYQLQEHNDLLQKKVLDLTKLVNILIIIVVFSAIGIVITIFQNQKIINLDKNAVETITEELGDIAEMQEFSPEEYEEEEPDEEYATIGDDEITKISRNSREINKLWNNYSILNNRIKSLSSTDKLENRFQTCFTQLESRTDEIDAKIGKVEISFYEKLDNIWSFLAEKGNSKMRKALGG